MSSEETQANKISIVFAKETKEVKLNGNSYKLHALTFNDLAELEDFTGTTIYDWKTNNPFQKLKNMIFCMHLSLKKDTMFKLSKQELGDCFNFSNAEQAGQIINEILLLSGIRKDDKEGNEQGAETKQ